MLAQASLDDGGFLGFTQLGLPLQEETTLTLKATLSPTATPGHGLSLGLRRVDCSQAAVTMESETARGYLVSPRVDHVVDGLFAEWWSPQTDHDREPVSDPNVDITHYDSAVRVDESFFYLRVKGGILAGVDLPSTRAMHFPAGGGGDGGGGAGAPNTGTQEEVPLPAKTGEDAIYILLDTAPETGYTNPGLELDADHMIVIRGQNGVVLSAKYFRFGGEDSREWTWSFIKELDAAAGPEEVETSVDEIPLKVYFHVVA